MGYDAIGTRTFKMALHQAAGQAGRGPVSLVVLDQDALTDVDGRHLEELRRISGAPILLLAPAMRSMRAGPWTQVVRRPVSIGSLVQAIEALVPLAPEARRPID
jgi:hypothetical protein